MGIKHDHSLARAATWAWAFWAALAPAWAAPVATTEARAQAAAPTQSLDGTLQAVRQATLASPVGGHVVSLLVKAGDTVRAGQAIAQVDEREALAGLQRSEAGVAQARAEARNASLVAERTRSLRAQGFVSQAALDQAETALQAAQAAEQAALAGRSQAAVQRGLARIQAPFDAVVLATHLDAGDLATPGRPVATVYAPGKLRAVVMVPSSLAAAARQASQVQILLADGRRLTPVASQWLPGADPVSQTVEWRLDLPAAALLPGQALRVMFDSPASGATAGPTAGLLLPQSAVLRRGELQAVYVQQGERLVLRAVRISADLGPAGVVVAAGLKAGERYALDAVAAGLDGATPAQVGPTATGSAPTPAAKP